MSKKVALVLSSGGARGLVQIGVIRELEDHGYTISSVAGSSMGALIGGLYAMGRLGEFTDWMRTLSRSGVFSLMDFTWSRAGVMKGQRVFDKIRTFIPDMLIENMSLPFTAVATDIVHQREVLFSTGSFYAAVRASVAIPGFFTPVYHHNHPLVDGGLLNPLPINHVKRNKGDILVAVNVNGAPDGTLSPDNEPSYDGYIAILQQSILTLINRIATLSAELYRPDMTIHIPHHIMGLWDYHKVDHAIEVGRAIARKVITASAGSQTP